jgi:hypothetical protein
MHDKTNRASAVHLFTSQFNAGSAQLGVDLAAENRIFRSHLPARLRLSDPQRCTLAEIGGWAARRLAFES